MLRSRLVPFLLAASLILVPLGGARAHPHGWIDLRTEVIFNLAGEVTALRQVWLFDEAYSAFSTEGFDTDGDGKPDPEHLLGLAQENMGNLEEFDYFTLVRSGDEKVGYRSVTDLAARMRGNRLETSFVLHLERPVDLTAHGLTYAVFDPSYWVEMLHEKNDQAIRLTGAPKGCGFKVEDPTPPADLVALAAALDKTQTAGNDLGIEFAQKVNVTCPQ